MNWGLTPKRLCSILALILASLAAYTILSIPIPHKWWIASTVILSLLLLILLYRSVVKPVASAQRGLELLSAQDLNNRLAKVGEPGADKIVTLFNNLITRLKNERLRIREQDHFLHLLIDASPMGIAMLDLDDRISMVNNAFTNITGISTESGSGKSLQELGNEITDALAGIKPGESAVIRHDGTRLYRCYHLWFIQEGFRRHFYLVESLTEEVRKAEKDAYEKVIRMISHEVNNTMGSVQSVLETLADETEDDPDLNLTIESCRERCESMCGFIDSFANLARIPEPVLKDVDLDEELTRMLPFMKLMAKENAEINLCCDNAENQIPKIVSADMQMLQQAILNIVKNAVESILEKENPCGGVSITTRRDNDFISLEIANDGIPISADVASRLFTSFFSTKRTGRGLGLTLISEILRKHSCSFSLRTHSDGITRFIVRFPQIQKD